eukprot:s1345_g8.t1
MSPVHVADGKISKEAARVVAVLSGLHETSELCAVCPATPKAETRSPFRERPGKMASSESARLQAQQSVKSL